MKEAPPLDVEIDDEGVVRLAQVKPGTLLVVEKAVLEAMLTEVYSAALCSGVRDEA